MSSALRSNVQVRTDARMKWVVLALAAAVVLVAFRGTWAEMAGVWWTSETFGHGIVVPVLAGWLAWRSRRRFEGLLAAPDWRGAFAFGLACFAWYVSELAGTAVVAQFAVTAMLPTGLWACMGWSTVRAAVGPLLFLFFMVPAGEALNPLLMEGTADATIATLRAVGIPVYREGLHFALPTGRWSVVEACSGLRYVIAAAMLATLFALLNFRGLHKRLLFVAAAIVLAILANWLRAILVVAAGHLSGMTIGVGDDHVVFGWVFFGVAMFGVFAMGAQWRDPEAVLATDDVGAGARGVEPPDAWTGQTSSVGVPSAPAQSEWKRLLVPVGLALLAFGTISAVGAARDVEPRPHVAQRASELLGSLRTDAIALRPTFEGARVSVAGTRPDGIEVYFAYFARQEAGYEMIAFGNAVLPEAGRRWVPLSSSEREVRLGGRALRLLEQHIRSGTDERLAWVWYTVGGADVGGSEYRAKAGTAWAMLRGRGDHSTVSVATAPLPVLPAAAAAAEVDAAMAAARERLQTAAAALLQLSVEATAP